MFDSLLPVVTWLFGEVADLARFVWTSCSWVGVCVICIPLVRKVVNIFRSLF